MQIADIVKINSGLVVSRKKVNVEGQAVKIYRQLNLRCIHKKGYIDMEEIEALPAKETIDADYITQKGDIIVRLTDPFTAVYITKEYEGLVVSSNFCILKNIGKVDLQFLSFYLNSAVAKRKLTINQQGSILKNVNISDIGQIEIPTISIERQLLYGKLLLAKLEQIKILNQLVELEGIVTDRIITSIVDKE